MKSLICHILYGDLPYRKDRRAHWPRILGWVIAWGLWGILIALWWAASHTDLLTVCDQ
jgi:hypothetical protein